MSTLPKTPNKGRMYRIWETVEHLVVSDYDALSDESMRGAYYIIRERIASLNQRCPAAVTDAEFAYFCDNYTYYRDDVWPRLERTHGFERPQTKAPTTVIEKGEPYTEARLSDAWDRTRGLIYVEKAGMAEKLTPLSNYGWLIVAGQGEATRTLREKLLADDTDRPILALTDADVAGTSIVETLAGESIRTAHLDFSPLEARVTNLGLTMADAEALALPPEPDPKGGERVELDSLLALGERATYPGDAHPVLAYTVAKMRALGIPVTPLPLTNPEITVRTKLTTALLDALRPAVDDAVDEVLTAAGDVETALPADGSGDLMRLRAPLTGGQAVDLTTVHGDLVDVAEDALATLEWERQTAYEGRVVASLGEDSVAAVEAALAD